MMPLGSVLDCGTWFSLIEEQLYYPLLGPLDLKPLHTTDHERREPMAYTSFLFRRFPRPISHQDSYHGEGFTVGVHFPWTSYASPFPGHGGMVTPIAASGS
jgi:hypothetical protein